MDKSEVQEFPMGDELKLIFHLDYLAKTLALTVLQKTDEGEEAEHDEWNMLSKVYYHSPHPKRLARMLNELAVIEEKAK